MEKNGMVPNILIGASSFVLLLTLMFGFGGTDTIVDVAIHFGMSLDTSEGQMHVYVNLPHPAHVLVKLYGFNKVDLETNTSEEVGLTDFFPSGDEPNTGFGGSSFDIELISSSSLPVLNLTQEFIPMVYIREAKRSAMESMILVIAAFALNNWLLVKLTMVLGMLLGLVLAVSAQFQGQKEVVEVMTE